MPTLEDRLVGSLLGLACGDAVGTTVEFHPRGSFPEVRGMTGGGPFSLAAGQWTDDTSMALCMAESLIERGGFDAKDQMTRYLTWYRWGYLSSTGECFDIGGTTLRALQRFEATGNPFSGTNLDSEAGNGSIMRLAPVVIRYHRAMEEAVHFAAESSKTTHAAAEAIDCCRLMAYAMVRAFEGCEKSSLLEGGESVVSRQAVAALVSGAYARKSVEQIRGSGYCTESLEAALWCLQATDTFEAAVLAAANLGDDADTTAAVVGQLAGAVYGAGAIPEHWRSTVFMGSEIETLALQLARF